MSEAVAKPQYSTLHLLLIGIAVCIPCFLASVDSFIVSSAISAISGQLGVMRETGLWLITLYTIAHVASIPLSIKCGILFGKRRAFLFGLALFLLASAGAGLTIDYNFLLMIRIIQGIGGGFIIPLSIAIIISHFPVANRGRAIGFWSMCVFVSPSMGPWIGGMLSNYLWHWMFLSNLPIGILCFILSYVVLEDDPPKNVPFENIIGIVLLWITLGCLQTFIDRGQLYDWFRSSTIIILCVATVVGGTLYFIWESFESKPIFRFHYFKNRTFAAATLITAFSMAFFFSSFTLESLWVQEVLGYPPLWAGYVMMPLGIIPPLLYPFVGTYIRRYGGARFVVFSLLIFSGTFFYLSRINLDTTFAHLATVRLIQGLAFPFLTVSSAITAYASATGEELPLHIGVYSFTRNLFVSLGISLSATLWIHRTIFYTTRLAARSHATGERFLSLFDRVLPYTNSKHQAVGLVNEQLVHQAKTLGLADIYYLYAWLYLALILLVFFYNSPKRVDTKA